MGNIIEFIKHLKSFRYFLPIACLVIAGLCASVILGSHFVKKEVKGITLAPIAHPTSTEKPTSTPLPTVPINKQTVKLITPTPLTIGVSSPTPIQTPQASGNTSTNNNSQSPITTQSPNTVLVPVVVKTNTPTPVPVDCSSVSSTVAAIKSEGQVALNTAIAGENNLLASRGITSDSPLYAQQMSAAELPAQNQTNTAIAQYCYSVASTGCSCP